MMEKFSARVDEVRKMVEELIEKVSTMPTAAVRFGLRCPWCGRAYTRRFTRLLRDRERTADAVREPRRGRRKVRREC